MKKVSGISLIVLVVTIVVILILVGMISLTLVGENGVIGKSKEAKIATNIIAIKEEIQLESAQMLFEDRTLTPELLLSQGKVIRRVQKGENNNYYLYYALKENAYQGMRELGAGKTDELKDVFLIDDELNIKYISKNGKEYGDEINIKLLEDETKIRFASKAFSDYVSKILGVEEDKVKFKWMKNQTNLTIADVNITSLEDLVFFPNLKRLQIGSYNTALYPNTGVMNIETFAGLENCIYLENLIIHRTNIEDISQIQSCKNLKEFSYSAGTIKNFSGLKDCNNLEIIKVDSSCCKKAELFNEIQNLENIRFFQYANNDDKILTIAELVKLKSISKIRELILNNNAIIDIRKINNFKNLVSLNLGNNNIEDITLLSENNELMNLTLRGNPRINGNRKYYEINGTIDKINQIGEILNKGGNIALDIDKISLFNNYKNLSLRNQGLENLALLEGMYQIETLDLYGNNITLKDDKSKEILKNMKNLVSIGLMNNKNLEDISVLNELTQLESIVLRGTKANLSQIEDILSNITIHLSVKEFKTIVECDENKITKLEINLNPEDKMDQIPDLSKFKNMASLKISGATADSYTPISELRNLEVLKLTNCSLQGKMINFSNMSKLIELNLSGNYLATEDLKKLEGLKNNKNMKIDLTNNSITDINPLLVLDESTRILLKGNVNLSQEAKDRLIEKFADNVSF